MAYPGQHGGTDFHVQLNQLHQQAGPSQSLQDMAQSASNVPMASAYAHQYPQLQEHQATNVQFVELAQIHQPVQHCYEFAHPLSNQYSQYHFHAPQLQDGSQTSIDEKSDHESLRNHDQSVGTSCDNCNQTPEHDHMNLQEGTDHHNADPVGECGAETPNDNCKVGDSAHGLILQ